MHHVYIWSGQLKEILIPLRVFKISKNIICQKDIYFNGLMSLISSIF